MTSNTKPTVLAVIPARGGSKGIPRKNLRLLAGRPLIAHSIAQAGMSRLVDRVVVSTDDPEIGEVSRACGAEVIWRPAELSSDGASSEAAILHALDSLKDSEAYEPNLVAFLQATSPIRRPLDIDGAIELLIQSKADSVLSATPWHGFTWKSQDNSRPQNYDPVRRPMRQERKEEYQENGSIYIFRPSLLRTVGSRLGGKVCIYPMDRWGSIDIDTEDDISLCEWILERQKVSLQLQELPAYPDAVIFDFDGVFTDNRVLVDQDGREAVACHRGDGLGVEMLRKHGIRMAVVSKEQNPVVAARSRKLKLECMSGIDDKTCVVRDWIRQNGLRAESVVYVANDVNDLGPMSVVGVPVAVGDAHRAVKRAARITLNAHGGYGAVRELCDLLLARMQPRSNGYDDRS